MLSRQDFLRREYEARFNRAIDFVYDNYSRDFALDEMADAANFSRFYFHRLFLAYCGETPAAFVRRVRLSQAANRLRYNPDMSISDVALACGFSGSSVFARQFKEYFGISATAWRNQGNDSQSKRKDSQAPGKDGKDKEPYQLYPDTTIISRRTDMKKLEYTVELCDLPARHVAYIRHIGNYSGIGEAFERLSRWAGPRGLFGPNTAVLAIYHDDPDTTPAGKLRSSACLTVPEGTAVDGDVGLMDVPGGKFAVGHFELAQDEFGAAWNALMGEWLPTSGWQPDDRMCYELYLNEHEQHPEKKFIVDICQPVKPL